MPMKEHLRSWPRIAAIVGVYVVAWLIFDRLSYQYAEKATPWYLATALSFYLVYTFGLRYAPAVVVANVARGLLSDRHHLTFAWLFALGFVTAVVVVAFVMLFRRMGVRFYRGFNDAIAYLVIGCLVFPFVRALVGVAIICASGSLQWANYWRDFYSFGVGDLVGMATLGATLFLFLTPLVAQKDSEPQEPNRDPMSRFETAAVFSVLAIGLVGGYSLVRSQNNAAVYFLVFLPLMWLVIRGGLGYGVIGLLVSDVTIVALQRYFQLPASAAAAYQSYVAASSFTVITLGAAVNQRRREEREAIERARTNAITGLPSRQSFEDWLASDSARSAAGATLLLVEVEAIRLADEWLDPHGADALQAGVGALLLTHTVGARVLAHVSSNIFAIVLSGDEKANATLTAQTLLGAFEAPINVGETELYISPSIGIAVGSALVEPITIFQHATQALRIARERGRSEIAFYDADRDQEAVLSLVAQLHRAHRESEFMLYYQPIWSCSFDAETGKASVDGLIGAEALLRWNHPERGMLTPAWFLDLLASMPLSERVGTWVIEQAAIGLSLIRESLPNCTMWVNLFQRQAFSRDLPSVLQRQLARYRLPADSFVIELNEKTIAEDEADLEPMVERLHALGVRVAVDDFGTGSSSYARLHAASIDILKIDKSFIPVGEPKGKTGDVLLSLMKFARDIGVMTVAEGVETDQQFAWLTRNGCSIVQGYVLGAPMPSYAFIDLAREIVYTRPSS